MTPIEMKEALSQLINKYVIDAEKQQELLEHIWSTEHPAVKWVLAELQRHGSEMAESDGQTVRDIAHWYL